MITIDLESCTGCGACLEVCPTNALYLVDGKASVDSALCRECEACLAACPTGAMALAIQELAVEEQVQVPALRPVPEIIQVKTQPAVTRLRTRLLPAVGTAMVWAGRELLPRLADSLVNALDRRATEPPSGEVARRREAQRAGTRGRGHQRRQRQRGGRG